MRNIFISQSRSIFLPPFVIIFVGLQMIQMQSIDCLAFGGDRTTLLLMSQNLLSLVFAGRDFDEDI